MDVTVKTYDVRSLKDQTLDAVDLKEFCLCLHFSNSICLSVEEYWEYLDAEQRLLDRSVAKQNRHEFVLPRLLGQSVSVADKILSAWNITFANGETLKICVQDDDRKSLKNYRPFGDGPVDPEAWNVI